MLWGWNQQCNHERVSVPGKVVSASGDCQAVGVGAAVAGSDGSIG